MIAGDTSYSRNVQYPTKDIQLVSSEVETETGSDSPDEWLSCDNFRVTKLDSAPIDESTETRCPNTSSELIFTFSANDNTNSKATSSSSSDGSLSYTAIPAANSLKDITVRGDISYCDVSSGMIMMKQSNTSSVLVHGRISQGSKYAYTLSPSSDDNNSEVKNKAQYIGRQVSAICLFDLLL